MSYGNWGEHADDVIGVSHRIVVQQVTPTPNPAVHHLIKVVTPGDVLKVLKSDFSEKVGEASPVFQEDLHFLTKLKENIKHKQDRRYEMPLPFKQNSPNFPNNKSYAEQRLKDLEKRLKRDETYLSDYVNFMQDIISCGDAEKVPHKELDNQPAWYIPHHGLYHPQKLEKYVWSSIALQGSITLL